MATSLLLMASDQDTTMKPTPLCGSPEKPPPKTEPSKTRGRKANNGKGPNQKKQSQRGMGVAKLEILRVQETLKMMRETSSVVPPSLLSPFPIHDPFPGNLPLQYGASANHVPLQCPPPPLTFNGNAVNPDGSGQGPIIGNPNNAGFKIAFGGGGGHSYGFAAPAWSPLVGSPMETSSELSSMPNAHYESAEHCDLCFKRKRFNDNNVVKGSNTRRDYASDIWPMINNGSSDLLGFTPQQAPNLPAETTDFTTRMTTHNASSHRNLDECVGVVAVHRKVSSMNGKVLMEYEFFPGKDYGRGTTSKELDFSFSTTAGWEASASASSSISAAAPRAWNNNAADTITASNSVDLSLRL